MMLNFDFYDMFPAISDTSHSGGPNDKGFLNRNTGEVIYLAKDFEEAKTWWGIEPAIDGERNRARMEASPGEWLEVPKFDRRCDGENNEEAFIKEFLVKNGLSHFLKEESPKKEEKEKATEGATTMPDHVARLLAEAMEDDQGMSQKEERPNWVAVGANWAKEHGPLKKLQQMKKNKFALLVGKYLASPRSGMCPTIWAYFAFCYGIRDCDLPADLPATEAFTEAFREGALTVLEEAESFKSKTETAA